MEKESKQTVSVVVAGDSGFLCAGSQVLVIPVRPGSLPRASGSGDLTFLSLIHSCPIHDRWQGDMGNNKKEQGYSDNPQERGRWESE